MTHYDRGRSSNNTTPLPCLPRSPTCLNRLLTASTINAARLIDAAAEYYRASLELKARSAGEIDWRDAVKFMVKDITRACAWETLVMLSADWVAELKTPTRVYSAPALVSQKRRATSDGGLPTPSPSQPTLTTVTYRLNSPRLDICIAPAHTSFAPPAQRTLKALQATGTLISDRIPGARARASHFVVEAKSPATLDNIFEGQNQAVTSGACALNIQRSLVDLTNEEPDQPLFSSMCTQGPLHEIWAHFYSPDRSPLRDSLSPGFFQMTRLAAFDNGGRCGRERAG
ncbi:hypothetical protein UCRNP2_5921 [Neofusicoccum parvum UCRNP2]|uniref:Uncharacterized protein n=1 Tax=Botryosphaeria parva (strain UCR-NP2) TaxID=1287680 RepID=R1EII2_BOTPV|nr:hypothetical protein UCRNP2_5921 [Neofusicoccum parvum UCRNP2]